MYIILRYIYMKVTIVVSQTTLLIMYAAVTKINRNKQIKYTYNIFKNVCIFRKVKSKVDKTTTIKLYYAVI